MGYIIRFLKFCQRIKGCMSINSTKFRHDATHNRNSTKSKSAQKMQQLDRKVNFGP